MSENRTNYTVDVDFCGDWADLLRKELNIMGCSAEMTDSPLEVYIKYYNSLLRQPSARPRKVLKSKEFTCPVNCQLGLNTLEEKVKKGEDIRPYLHHKLSNSDYQDGLLNDWGIHHFHLGEIDKQNGKVIRTGPLLYALVKDDYFYMINIMGHNDFSRQRLVDIVYSNWPNVVEDQEIKGAFGLDYVCNDDEVSKLRNNGISTLTMRSDGTVHLPIGGGITTSKASVNVVRQSKKCLQALMAAERLLKRDAGEIAQSAIARGYAVGGKLSFVLRMEDNLFFGVEKSSGFAVHLPGLEKILYCQTPELT